MRYKAEVVFTFKGIIDVRADDKQQAQEYLEKHVGCVLPVGAIHSSLDDEDVDWTFDTHPIKKIGKITRV